MMTTIAPDQQDSSHIKELLLFAVIGLLVFTVIMLPSFALMYLTTQKPEIGVFLKFVTEQTKSDIVDEFKGQQQNTNQVINDTTSTTNTQVTIKKAITDIYNRNNLRLTLFIYPAQCNVGRVTGDFVQFNSNNCYTADDIENLRYLFKSYFAVQTTEEMQKSIETSILQVIEQGTPYQL